MKNYYDILGVSKNASKEEIKQAFRKLAIENHPDKGGQKEKFQEIQEAYEILGNDDKKREYDAGPRITNGSNFEFFFNFGGNNSNQKIKKSNHFYNCDITLRDVHFGLTKKIKVKRDKYCEKCFNSCQTCDGLGQFSRTVQMGPFVQHIKQTCKDCSGQGILYKNTQCCNENGKCNNGKISEEKIFEIQTPKGIHQNKQYIYSGWGEQAMRKNEISGDLIISINIKEDEVFKRKDLNLICELEFSLIESIIGKNIKLNVFDEILNLNSKIFGILNPNKQYIIYGKGLNGVESKRGDLYITVKINYPEKTLNDNEIEILKKTFQNINLL